MQARPRPRAVPWLLLAGVVALVACGSSSGGTTGADAGEPDGTSGTDGALQNGGDGGTEMESGTSVDGAPAPDASPDATSGHDASTPDAATDASNRDASLPPPTCTGGQRPFLVVNGCSQPVQIVVTAGATSAACGAGDTCAPVGTCNTSNDLCYWPLPDLGANGGLLVPGASQTVCFEAPIAGQNTQWSGNLAGQLGCASGSASCPPQPVTLAEFTLANQTTSPPGTDFYDVSVINGMDVSMSMVPVAGTFTAQQGDPYSCGGPGATSSTSSLGACSWNVQPTVHGTDETTWTRAVVPGGSACTSDTQCSGGTRCGLSQHGASFSQTCGAPLGWWTADQICGVDPSFGAPYDCASAVQNSNATTSTYTQLFQCSGPEQSQSCYSNGATKDCCGCGTDSADWPKTTGPGFSCKNDNPNWQSVAEPWLAFLKKACPTAYVYPFDDATSTFTCTGANGSTPVSYVVTFCP
jgi:hypothetical protein